MGAICPQCKRRCDANDLYCPACGTSLIGAVPKSQSYDPDRREPVASAPPMPPASQDHASSANEPDFIPLILEAPTRSWYSGGYRRWLLLGIGIMVLLAGGIAVVMDRDGGEGDRDLADVPAVMISSSRVSPPAASPIAVPAEIVEDAVPTGTAIIVRARPASPPASPVVAAGEIEVSDPIDERPRGDGTGGAILVPGEGARGPLMSSPEPAPTVTASGD